MMLSAQPDGERIIIDRRCVEIKTEERIEGSIKEEMIKSKKETGHENREEQRGEEKGREETKRGKNKT